MKLKPTSITSVPLSRILSACFVLTSATVALAQSEASADWQGHKVCSNRTLLGHYGAKIEGKLLDFPGQPLLRTLVLYNFKGDGRMTSKAHAVLNGKLEEDDWSEESVGFYTVNPDCTGSAENINPPIKFHFIVVDQGTKFFLVLDGGATTGVAEKVH
jgi:hypothetical protein